MAKTVKTKGKAAKRTIKTLTVPGAGLFRCPKKSCERNKTPFKFKMHAAIHANASKHGKPVEITGRGPRHAAGRP
jgi:hypothetical protein